MSALLAGLALLPRAPAAWRRVWFATFVCLAVLLLGRLVATARDEIASPPLWDFKVFWMIGHVAASGHNVYEPASYLPYRAALNPAGNAEFDAIALGIGMPYPPPAIVLFYPLGFTTIATGMTLWYAFLFATLALGIGLLFRTFFAPEGKAGALAAAALVLALPATAATVGLAQINFLALCFLLLFWRERDDWRAGLWLAVLLVVRPLFVVLAIALIARRRWKALLASVAAVAAASVCSIPLVGWNGFLAYLRANPSGRYPQAYFAGFESLYKVVSQLDNRQTSYFSILGHPAYAVASLALLTAGCVVCVRANGPARDDACLALLVALGLLLYPNTGAHYAVFLLAPAGALWRYRQTYGIGAAGAVAFLAVEYALLTFGASTAGAVFALDIGLFSLLALGSSRQRPGAVRG